MSCNSTKAVPAGDTNLHVTGMLTLNPGKVAICQPDLQEVPPLKERNQTRLPAAKDKPPCAIC